MTSWLPQICLSLLEYTVVVWYTNYSVISSIISSLSIILNISADLGEAEPTRRVTECEEAHPLLLLQHQLLPDATSWPQGGNQPLLWWQVERWGDGVWPCSGSESWSSSCRVRLCPSDIDGDFKSGLAKLVPLLLAPEQLVEKEIGGNKVTCRDLLEYFKVLQPL